ncbi:MAG: hypothetical protein ACREM2_10210 [Vulcanimicrobiaceae bacterium]
MAVAHRLRLLDRALALPLAREADFAAGRRPPADAEPAHLRMIDDTALRTRLIDARLAEGLQSPKGPQKIASIVRIYPDFDAPAGGPSRRLPQNGRAPRAARAVGRKARADFRATGEAPTVEELDALLARIREVEAAVAHDLRADLDARIARLKAAIATLDGASLEAAHAELGTALSERRALAARIRNEAFARIASDADFAPRIHLRLLAPREP